VKVTPKSSRDALLGWLGEALKIAVTAAPERGRANEAVEALLARTLEIAASRVSVVSGHSSSRKRVAIKGLDAVEARRRLTGAISTR
jgi:uncharacterized protein YggU (UPF0235/DUF167 family)